MNIEKPSQNFRRLAVRFPRRRAVITGAAAGLGKAIASELAKDGWSLLLIDQDRAGLAEVTDMLAPLHAAASWAVLDVCDEARLRAAISDFCEQSRGLDLLVNAAGIGLAGYAHEAQGESLRKVFEVNVIASAVAASAVLPYMLKAGSGHVLNVASAAAYHCLPWIGGYSASKAAVVALTENLCAECHGTGVTASVMISAFFRSSMSRYTIGGTLAQERTAGLMAMSRMTAEEAAVLTLRGIESGGPYIFVGSQARVIYWFKRLFPRAWLRVARKVSERAFARADAMMASAAARTGS